MTAPIGPKRALAATATDQAQLARLHKAAQDLEGVFVNEMFKAMRATVPQDGLLPQNPGQDMFTSLMDERLAERYAEHAGRGIGEALYRQLSRGLSGGGGATPTGGTP
ncbi:MAG TPA: rod-binding protein [Gemmatimonadales bacterium]|nr:rod-binding protein [Gemmatimonadales bacterium]